MRLFQRLLNHYKDIGYPIDAIKMTKGRRRFQFGGDASQWSDWSAHIPVFVDGKFRAIEIFLMPGNTPMLCGRLIIEALGPGVSMDFARRQLRIGSSPWQAATLGRQGEYLWPITQEHDLMKYDPQKPEFELRTNVPDVHQTDGFHLAVMKRRASLAMRTNKCHDSPSTALSCLRKHDLQTMDVQLTTHLNDFVCLHHS